jgi:hypothetical protein
LGGNVIAALKPGSFAKYLVQLIDLGAVTVKNFHKGCLTACRPLGTSESEVRSHVLNVLEIKDELLQPLSCSTPDSDGLGCLIVPSHK